MISTYFSIKIIKCVFSRVSLFNVEFSYLSLENDPPGSLRIFPGSSRGGYMTTRTTQGLVISTPGTIIKRLKVYKSENVYFSGFLV